MALSQQTMSVWSFRDRTTLFNWDWSLQESLKESLNKLCIGNMLIVRQLVSLAACQRSDSDVRVSHDDKLKHSPISWVLVFANWQNWQVRIPKMYLIIIYNVSNKLFVNENVFYLTLIQIFNNQLKIGFQNNYELIFRIFGTYITTFLRGNSFPEMLPRNK